MGNVFFCQVFVHFLAFFAHRGTCKRKSQELVNVVSFGLGSFLPDYAYTRNGES